MAKYYVFDGVINGKGLKERKFKSRNLANKYMEKILYQEDLQVEDVINRSHHDYEYFCSERTRFFINRVVVY